MLNSVTEDVEKKISSEEKSQRTATTSPEKARPITVAHSTPQKKMKRRTNNNNNKNREEEEIGHNYNALIGKHTQTFNIGLASYGELTSFHGYITKRSCSIGTHTIVS